MQEEYNFNLLHEAVAVEDLFEDKTHKKISESIVDLIGKENNGITIGLEGPWGSGKSSIISMMRKMFDEESLKKIAMFQFDTWAHEGDYLRKIFLTSFVSDLMSQFSEKDIDDQIKKELNDCLDKISNHKVTKTIIRKRTLTGQGILFTISALFVPFGAAFLSNINLDSVSISGFFYPKFFIGLLSVFAPIICAFFNLVFLTVKKLCLKRKKIEFRIYKSGNWSFLQDNDTQDETKEFSEENERTSVEFEEQFFKILGIIFDNKLLDKIVIVIDNLDRVDEKYALKVWSTLQIFLQERNEICKQKEYFDRIWTLVPYDPDGLTKLWDAKGDNGNSKSFFDKCFQLRIDVPKPIFSSWEKYTRNLMETAIPDWNIEDKEELIKILQLTRKTITDIPTPRELKNFINQTAYLASRWGMSMEMSSIAYYVVWRELEHTSVKDIQERLKDSKLIESSLPKGKNFTSIHSKGLKGNYISYLAGLVFGVEPAKGYQLLLLPEIKSALERKDGERLKGLAEKNGDGFWVLFNQLFLSNDFEDKNLVDYSVAIYNGLAEYHKNLESYLTKLANINTIQNFNFYESSDISEFSCALFLQDNSIFKKRILKYFYRSFKAQLAEFGKTPEKIPTWIENSYIVIDTLFINIESIIDEVETIELTFNLDQFKSWIKGYIKSENLNISRKFICKQELIDSLSAELPGLPDFKIENEKCFSYLLNNEANLNWTIFHTNAYKLLTSKPTVEHSILIDFILKLILNNKYEDKHLTTYRDTWPIYNAVHYFSKGDLIPASILIGLLQRDKLKDPNITHGNSSQNGLKVIQEFWMTDKVDNARALIKRIVKYQSDFIWDIAKNTDFKLALRIIQLSAEEKCLPGLFSVENKLSHLNDIISMTNDEEIRDKVAIALITEGSDFRDEIIQDEEIKYPDSVYYFLKNSTSIDSVLKSFVKDKLKKFDIERWKQELTEASFFLDIALQLNELTKGQIHQGANYLNALIDISEDILNNEDSVEIWTKENWDRLLLLLTKSAINTYKQKILKLFKDNFNNASLAFLQINRKYLNFESFFIEVSKTMELFIELVSVEDKDRFLFFMEEIKKFNGAIYNNISNEQKKNLIEVIIKNKQFFKSLDSEVVNHFFILFKIDILLLKDEDKE